MLLKVVEKKSFYIIQIIKKKSFDVYIDKNPKQFKLAEKYLNHLSKKNKTGFRG